MNAGARDEVVIVGAAVHVDAMASFLSGRIEIVRGDITILDVDMIVNAANAALCGGGGVDGAIHAAAGDVLLAECRTLGAARPGEVKVTGGYALTARFIAHAVGPVWRGGDHDEDALLASCYAAAIAQASARGLRTLAFPSISTGAYRFPLERAARIALGTVRDGLAHAPGIACVTFCCFTAVEERTYRKVAAATLVC